VDLNGNGVYDADVREGYADIFGTKILLDFGLDGLPNTGDFGEGNGVWDGETFEDLNENYTWDCY
jgi:hypothetical protein